MWPNPFLIKTRMCSFPIYWKQTRIYIFGKNLLKLCANAFVFLAHSFEAYKVIRLISNDKHSSPPSQVSVTFILMRKSFLVAIDLILMRWISLRPDCASLVSSQWLTPREPLYPMQWWNVVPLASGCVHIAPHSHKRLVVGFGFK